MGGVIRENRVEAEGDTERGNGKTDEWVAGGQHRNLMSVHRLGELSGNEGPDHP
jgi:hypothetical protein